MVTPGAGHPIFSEDQVQWLLVCSKMRSSGMSLPDIRRYAELTREGPGTVAELDFLTAVAAPSAVITALGVLEPDPKTKELTLNRLHPGATEEPTADELAARRALIAR